MIRNRKWNCFCILSFCCLMASGCGDTAKKDSVEDMLKTNEGIHSSSQPEYVSLGELEELAENNTWQEDIGARVSFETDWHGSYGYESLTETERLWYDDINLLLSTRYEDCIQLSKEGMDAGLTEDSLDKIYQCVLMDHPEYFYVTGYEYTKYTSMGKLLGIEVNATYNADMQECILRQEQIQAETDRLLAQAPVDASDYEKIKFVYETIIYHTEYDLAAPDNQNIYSVFVGKASVCQGYAKATQYLLGRLGVSCTLVQGEIRGGEGHSWNMVKSGGKYYYVDTTWGDASYTSDGEALTQEVALEINYDYLCVTTEQLFQTHIPDSEIPLPICDATEDNYYVREGCYFTEYDTEQLKREFSQAASIGQQGITIKCNSLAVYLEMYEELINNQKVFEYLPKEQQQIAFVEDEKHLSMTFWMTK